MPNENKTPPGSLGIEWKPTDWLKPYKGNSRLHSPEQIERIVASIKRFGFVSPILAMENGTIIAGHGRLQAALLSGLTTVPVIVLAGMTETEARAYCIADNRLAELADWDENILKAELIALRDDDLELMLATGYSETDLAELLADETNDLDGEDDEVKPEDGPAITQPGDVWLLGEHRIICGDSTSADVVNKLLAGAKPHLMVTDPPYGVEYDASWCNEALGTDSKSVGKVLNDDIADWSAAYALFPGGVAYVWHPDRKTVDFAQSLLKTDFELKSLIVWAKDSLVLGRSHYHFQTELCWYAIRKGETGHWNGSRTETNLWEIAKQKRNDTIHSTQKPVECMLRPIVNNSLPGEYIYEPFSGSGTTIIACEKSNRKCLAIELNPAYVDVAIRRWEKTTGKQATLEADGRTFAEVAGA